MSIRIEQAGYEHIDALAAAGVRQSDWRECFITTGMGVGAALKAGLHDADVAAAAFDNDAVVSVFGVTRRNGAGCVWLAGTEQLNSPKFVRRMTRTARKVLPYWQKRHGALTCLLDPQNAKTRAWLEHLGFEQDSKAECGPLGHALLRMWRK